MRREAPACLLNDHTAALGPEVCDDGITQALQLLLGGAREDVQVQHLQARQSLLINC